MIERAATAFVMLEADDITVKSGVLVECNYARMRAALEAALAPLLEEIARLLRDVVERVSRRR